MTFGQLDQTFDNIDPTGFNFTPALTLGDTLKLLNDAFWAATFVGFSASSLRPDNGLRSLNIGLSPYGDVVNDRIC